MNTPHTPLTLEQRTALADRMDELIEEVIAGWSVPVMEGFFMALAVLPQPPEVSAWLQEALPVQTLSEEERDAITTDVMRVYDDVCDYLRNEDSEWVPLFVHTEQMDAALTALGFMQGLEHFAPKQWMSFSKENRKSAATIRTMANFALEDGTVTKAQFDAVEKGLMGCVFEVYEHLS